MARKRATLSSPLQTSDAGKIKLYFDWEIKQIVA